MVNFLNQASLVSDVPVLGPQGVAVTGLTTVASQVLAADAVRHGVLFHNPGATYNKRVLPLGPALAGGAGGILIAPQTSFVILEDEAPGTFSVNCGWQAVTDNNADGTLTVLNFTDSNPGAPIPALTIRQTQGNPGVSSPNPILSTTLGTASIPILTANPSRRGVIFHNPGSVNIGVCPSNLTAAIGAGSIIILPGAEVQILGNRRIKINCAWNGIAASSSNNDLTMLELLG